jgi:hypothetical protein
MEVLIGTLKPAEVAAILDLNVRKGSEPAGVVRIFLLVANETVISKLPRYIVPVAVNDKLKVTLFPTIVILEILTAAD